MEKTRPTRGGNAFTGKVVVVIDDDELVRRGTQSLLRAWGCQAVAADSLKDAQDQLKHAGLRPDALIVDYRLRHGLGTDAIVALRKEYGSRLPAALITGELDKTALQRIAAHEVSHLHKPVAAANLRRLLETLLGAA